MTRPCLSLESASAGPSPEESLYLLRIHPPVGELCANALSVDHPELHLEVVSTVEIGPELTLSYLRAAGPIEPRTLIRELRARPQVRSADVIAHAKGLALVSVVCKSCALHRALVTLTQEFHHSFVLDQGGLVHLMCTSEADATNLFARARQTGLGVSLRLMEVDLPRAPSHKLRGSVEAVLRSAMERGKRELVQLTSIRGVASVTGWDEVRAAREISGLRSHLFALPSRPFLGS